MIDKTTERGNIPFLKSACNIKRMPLKGGCYQQIVQQLRYYLNPIAKVIEKGSK